MSRNIKEIGKELMGKSLNSYHRKTGLTQLEENNKMQDGILNGILSQVDDAYIEKTEQSNVIHLDGSGDGVVVVDSIEGNTMVNIWDINKPTVHGDYGTKYVKPNTIYTIIGVGISGENAGQVNVRRFRSSGGYGDYAIKVYSKNENSIFKGTITTNSDDIGIGIYSPANLMSVKDIMILEGDWTNKPISTYFEGLQSSFEEKVNEDGKYEIEILSKNNNLIEESVVFKYANYTNAVKNVTHYSKVYSQNENNITKTRILGEPIPLIQNKTMYFKCDGFQLARSYFNKDLIFLRDDAWKSNTTKLEPPKDAKYIALYLKKSDDSIITDSDIKFVKENAILGCFEKYEDIKKIAPKQNKIKLLINEPLRGIGNFKDRLLVKDNKLVIERNCNTYKFNSKDIVGYGAFDNTVRFGVYWGSKNDNRLNLDASYGSKCVCNILPYNNMWSKDEIGFYCDGWSSTGDDVLRQMVFRLDKTMVGDTLDSLKNWINNNELIVVYKTLNPIYEEVVNEYGEPILLEGYENGTLYIDSTIIPTTTVRYTPKMESLKTLREVSNNNVMLTTDINDTIIPYMMEVDLMIMEKEVALMSQKNIRKIGAEDMTSMQKRTQQMLERLVKGKTLTEQECKTRVTVYLNAGKITDEQAKELNFLIDEIYA